MIVCKHLRHEHNRRKNNQRESNSQAKTIRCITYPNKKSNNRNRKVKRKHVASKSPTFQNKATYSQPDKPSQKEAWNHHHHYSKGSDVIDLLWEWWSPHTSAWSQDINTDMQEPSFKVEIKSQAEEKTQIQSPLNVGSN